MNQPLVVAVLGRGVVDPGEVRLPPDDLGLTRGDGCFDAMRLVRDAEGVTVQHREGHLARFARSAAALELPPIDQPAWSSLIEDAAEAWVPHGAAVCKVMWTRGSEYGTPGPTGLVLVTPAPTSCVPLRLVTLDLGRPADAFAGKPWLLGGVKTLSYAVNVAAKREATRRGVDDVCFVTSDGHLLEGPTSSVLVARDGVLLTTPIGDTGVLDSVTVAAIAEAAAPEGLEVRARLMAVEELALADGVWMVSAVRGVCPVVEVDGRPQITRPDLGRRLAEWAGFEIDAD